jgi:hypothetical protein
VLILFLFQPELLPLTLSDAEDGKQAGWAHMKASIHSSSVGVGCSFILGTSLSICKMGLQGC